MTVNKLSCLSLIKKLRNMSDRVKTKAKGKSISAMLFRLLIAWLMVSAFYIANSGVRFTNVLFFREIRLSVFLSALIVIWVLLCKIADDRFIRLLMILTALVYGILGAMGNSSFSFSVGCCAAVGIIVSFTDLSDLSIKLHPTVPWLTAGVLLGGFTAFVGIISCLYYLNYWTSCFDFGIFSQMFYYMKETGLPLATCERDGLLSHFAVHFSPVFYLLLPIYWILPDPRTLLILQAFIVASGVIPLMLICKRHRLGDAACCGFAVSYTLYPCFAGGCFYYLHENNFLAPLVLWLIYFCERGRTLPKLGLLLLLLTVKEDAAVYAAVISLYFLFTDKNYKCNLSMLLISVLYFAAVTHFLAAYGDGVMTGRYDNYIYDESGSLVTVILAVLKNPVYVLEECFTEEKLIFILQMLLPLGFLPLITKEPRRLILLIPFLLVNLMTQYRYQYDIGFQYCFGSGALLIYTAVVNYSEQKRPKLLLCSVMSSVIVFFGLYHHRLDYFKAYAAAADQRSAIDRAITLIPDDASVVSSTFILPDLSQRRELYELETTKREGEYYVIDLRIASGEEIIHKFFSDDYELLFYEEDAVALFRRNR